MVSLPAYDPYNVEERYRYFGDMFGSATNGLGGFSTMTVSDIASTTNIYGFYDSQISVLCCAVLRRCDGVLQTIQLFFSSMDLHNALLKQRPCYGVRLVHIGSPSRNT